MVLVQNSEVRKFLVEKHSSILPAGRELRKKTKKKQKNFTPVMSEKYSSERMWMIKESRGGKEDEDKDEENGQGALGSFFKPRFCSLQQKQR